MFVRSARVITSVVVLFATIPAQAQESSEGQADAITWRDVTAENMHKADNHALYGFIVHHWTPERIEMLDPLFERARTERLKRDDGSLIIDELRDNVKGFHSAFNAAGQDYLRETLVDWANQAPESTTAQSLRIAILIEHAWNLRGSGYAQETTDQEFESFHEVIYSIVELIEEHETVLSRDAHFFDDKITIQMATGGEIEEIEDSVAKYLELMPEGIHIFGNAAYAVSPRWSGSAELYSELARFGYEHTKERFGLASYFLVVRRAYSLDGIEPLFSEYGFNFSTFLKAVEDYHELVHPNYNWALNYAAKFLVLRGERERALPYFERLKGEPNYNLWPEAEFRAWESWAKGEGPAPKYGKIHDEAKDGNLAYFEAAVSRETDLNKPTERGHTPIHIAAENGHWELVRFLASNGADPSTSSFSPSPLSMAINAREAETALVLIDNGAKPDFSWGTSGVPIYLATLRDLPEVVQALADHVDVIIDQRGFSWRTTPLHQAILKGNLEIATILLDHGAMVDAWSGHGRTILGDAAHLGHLPLINLLLERGADVNIENFTGFTPLFSAASENKSDVVDRLLLEEDIDINFPSYFGDTALSIAAEHGYVGIVKTIAERPEVELNGQNFRGGSTALHAAVDAGSTGSVRALLKAGADKTLTDHEGRTPEALARELGQERLVKLLVKE